jgi:NAD(P)-dependent dehydrogenase (short-subunit alcohol dehydrogenase family)
MERVRGREAYEQGVRNTPLGRGAESADIAAAVVYLASDAAQHVNGIEYNIDGGESAR